MIVEKPLSELSPGQYILDIVEQTGSYSLKQPGHIKSASVINHLLKKGVETVLIDTSKTLVAVVNDETGDVSYQTTGTPEQKQAELKLELTKAKTLFSESKHIQKQILNDVLAGKELDLAPVKQATNDTINAIFKNPDALACILNVRIKDEYLLEHSVSVSVLMAIFCRHLGFDKQLTQQLTIGAFLHDVGKVKVPDSILNKPSRLTEAEFEIMKSHANHSIDIISHTAGISELSLEVAAQHHEKLNGQGYPFQLKSDDISQYGRMITICDIFDALTADRCYKDGYSHIKAFSILRKLAENNELDTILVDRFIQCMGVYPVGSLVELSSHRLAIVESRNKQDPIRPKVRAFYNVDFKRYTMTRDIDLAKSDDHILKGVRANDFNLDMNRIVEFLMMQG